MTKQTKMLLGVGAVAVVGYLIYKNNTKKSFVGDKRTAVGARTKGGMASRTAVSNVTWQPIGDPRLGCMSISSGTIASNMIGSYFEPIGLAGKWKVVSSTIICPLSTGGSL